MCESVRLTHILSECDITFNILLEKRFGMGDLTLEAPEFTHFEVLRIPGSGLLALMGIAGVPLPGNHIADVDVMCGPEVLALIAGEHFEVVQHEAPLPDRSRLEPCIIYKLPHYAVVAVCIDGPMREHGAIQSASAHLWHTHSGW